MIVRHLPTLSVGNCNVDKDSWKFFDRLLKRAQVVTTPGAGLGRCGQGFIRISAFNSRENVEEAMKRLRKVLRSSGT